MANKLEFVRSGAAFFTIANNTFTATSGAYTQVTALVERYDYQNDFASNTFTVPEDGLYDLGGCCAIAALADQKQTLLAIFVNGVFLVGGGGAQNSGTSSLYPTISALGLDLQTGDLVTLRIYNGDTVNRTAGSSDGSTYFSGRRVG